MFKNFLDIRIGSNFIEQIINFLEVKFALQVCINPTITPATLGPATYGQTFSQQLTSSESTATIWESSNLPAGATLSSTGLLSWTNIPPGTYTFNVDISYPDQSYASCHGTRTYTLVISEGNYRLSHATQADQYNRLQHFMCCLGSKGAALATKLKYSADCCCDINTLELLVMYWDVLECYDPTLTTNCLTQTQIDAIWDDISCKCGICFSPYGSTYVSSSGCGNRVTADGHQRVTTSGDIRITGCGSAAGNSTPNNIIPDDTFIYYS